MALALVIVVGFLLYLWARDRSRRAEELRSLRSFSHRNYLSESSDDAWDDWEADLVAMTVVVRPDTPDAGPSSSDPLPIRRSGSGRWSIQNRDEAGKRTWQRIPAEVAGPLESQYQRFLLRWRST